MSDPIELVRKAAHTSAQQLAQGRDHAEVLGELLLRLARITEGPAAPTTTN